VQQPCESLSAWATSSSNDRRQATSSFHAASHSPSPQPCTGASACSLVAAAHASDHAPNLPFLKKACYVCLAFGAQSVPPCWVGVLGWSRVPPGKSYSRPSCHRRISRRLVERGRRFARCRVCRSSSGCDKARDRLCQRTHRPSSCSKEILQRGEESTPVPFFFPPFFVI
jgi:hypothetical protein